MNIPAGDLLICPKNDPESLTILRLSGAMNLAALESNQPHGAKLELEENLMDRIAKYQPQRIVIVEIPGPDVEDKLRRAGYEIVLIDHHRYGELDRSNPESSLEQFLNLYEITNGDIEKLGFDPVLIRGVGAMDRGFIWAVEELPYSNEEKDSIIAYYEALLRELGGALREDQEREAKVIFAERTQYGDYLYFDAKSATTRLRDALSFEIGRHFRKPMPSIIDMKDTLYVQETEAAEELLREFGGFTFGTNCFGIEIASEEERAAILEKLKML